MLLGTAGGKIKPGLVNGNGITNKTLMATVLGAFGVGPPHTSAAARFREIRSRAAPPARTSSSRWRWPGSPASHSAASDSPTRRAADPPTGLHRQGATGMATAPAARDWACRAGRHPDLGQWFVGLGLERQWQRPGQRRQRQRWFGQRQSRRWQRWRRHGHDSERAVGPDGLSQGRHRHHRAPLVAPPDRLGARGDGAKCVRPRQDAMVRASVAVGMFVGRWLHQQRRPADGWSRLRARHSGLGTRRRAAGGQPAILGKILPCGLGTGDGTTMVPCAQQFVSTFGPELYRRPLTPGRARTLRGFDAEDRPRRLQELRLLGDVDDAAVAARALPHELGVADGTTGKFKLTSYEVASALAYTFTGGPPTADLMMLASGDQACRPRTRLKPRPGPWV